MKRLMMILLLTGLFTGCGKGGKEEPDANKGGRAPSLIQDATELRNLAELQSKFSRGVVTPRPWVGYWWPYGGTGIASNWRDAAGRGPADKYDVAYVAYLREHGGNPDAYESMAAWERGRHGPGLPLIESWWGHCNGWAASSLMVPEPRVSRTIGGITFDVRDLKALLAESWMEFSGDFVGNRINDKGDFSSAAFWDVAPAQFHLMLTNIVGRQNRGLIFDRHTGAEIWNQPLVGYIMEPIKQEEYLGAHPQFPDIYRINVATRIWWANDNVDPDDVSPNFDLDAMRDEYFDRFYPGRRLKYELWLDAPAEFDAAGNLVRSGNVLVSAEGERYVGGVWKNASSPEALINTHPDYMWVPYGVQHSSGYKNPRIDDTWVRDHIGAPRTTNGG